MRAIKKNMKDQILTQDNKILYCRECSAEYSGNSGDYWNMPENHIFKCCDIEMELVEKIISVKYI